MNGQRLDYLALRRAQGERCRWVLFRTPSSINVGGQVYCRAVAHPLDSGPCHANGTRPETRFTEHGGRRNDQPF